jgi:DNA-binding response OmpR family regulator
MRDITVRSECSRLWGQLTPDERETLQEAVTVAGPVGGARSQEALLTWGLLTECDDGSLEVFSRLFGEYIQRHAAVQQNLPGGVWMDEDSGDVWIDGIPAPSLTDLEYRLLALLFGRQDKLTDKYQIVEAVWGVEYIDEVDDARIDKLVSRLRAKIEPDPSEPRYLLTVRGRGYRLVAP